MRRSRHVLLFCCPVPCFSQDPELDLSPSYTEQQHPRRCPLAQTEQDGTVVIAGPNEATVQAAAAKIRAIVSEVEVGAVYRRAPHLHPTDTLPT